MPQTTVEEKLKILKAISPYLDQSELAELQKDLIKMADEGTSIGRRYAPKRYQVRSEQHPTTGPDPHRYYQKLYPGHPLYSPDDPDFEQEITKEEFDKAAHEREAYKSIKTDYDKRRSALEKKIKDVQERQARTAADLNAPAPPPAETKTSKFKSRMEEVGKKRIEQQKLKQQSQYASKMTKRLPAMKQALADLEQQKKDSTVASAKVDPVVQAKVDPVASAKVDPVASTKVDPVVKVAEPGSDSSKIKKVVKKVTESEPVQKIKKKLVERKTSERRVVKNARRDLATAEEELKAATTPKASMRAKEKIRRAKERLEKHLKK